MASTESMRDYRMFDATLCQLASDLCNKLIRDLAEISPFGITNELIVELKAIGDSFEIFPPDDALLGELMVATQSKNLLAEQVREMIRNMALRVQIKWGANSVQYTSLGNLNLTRLMEDVLLTIARNVHTRMLGYLIDLASTGLSPAMLNDFADLNEAFEQARNEVKNKIEVREMKTKERIAKGNELFSYVVRYCEIGKRIYEKTNAAKYNDYMIYQGNSRKGKAPVSPNDVPVSD